MNFMKTIAMLTLPVLLASCQVKNLDQIVGIDGRFLKEFNENIQLGGVYYEDPPSSSNLPVALNDLCLVSNNIHNVKVPNPNPQRLPDRTITLIKNGKVQGEVSGQFGRFFQSALSLEAASNDIKTLNIKLSDITKIQISNLELSNIRSDIFSKERKHCPRFLKNAHTNGLVVHHIKALYFGDINIETKVFDDKSAGAEVSSVVKAKVEGKIGQLFNSAIMGKQNLFAVELQPQSKWRIFDS